MTSASRIGAGLRGITLGLVGASLLGGCTVLGETQPAVPPPASSPLGSLAPLSSLTPLVIVSLSPASSPSPTASPAPASVAPSVVPSSTPMPSPTTSPAPAPTGRAHVKPLPPCQYTNEPAVGDPDADWSTMVLDTIYRLPADFVPKRLVSTKKAGMEAGYGVIPAMVDDLRALHEASIAAGAEVAVRWAYRSFAEQQHVFGLYSRQSGRDYALTISARPGHSEHQMGTAIDFRSADSLTPPWDYKDWGTTKPGRWMGENAWRYGFVLSYPKDMTDETCYAYEPWHYRYVGRDVAAAIHASGLTPRRYLWETYQGRR